MTGARNIWIIRNQLGRRNLTLTARCALAEKLAEALRPKAKENQKQSKGRGKKGSSKLTDLIDVREQAAKEAKVSAGSMHAYAFVKQHADAATMQRLLIDPNEKIHRVAKEINVA